MASEDARHLTPVENATQGSKNFRIVQVFSSSTEELRVTSTYKLLFCSSCPLEQIQFLPRYQGIDIAVHVNWSVPRTRDALVQVPVRFARPSLRNAESDVTVRSEPLRALRVRCEMSLGLHPKNNSGSGVAA